MLPELTFIVLPHPLEPPQIDAELTNEDIKALPMIGDVNLFKNPREDPEFEVEFEVMIAVRCPAPIQAILSPHLPNEQGKTHPSFSQLLQSPRTVVNGAHTQRSSSSCHTRVTSSA